MTAWHSLAATLPRHHDDPFDQMLIAQARIEGLTVVTRDPAFRDYGLDILSTLRARIAITTATGSLDSFSASGAS